MARFATCGLTCSFGISLSSTILISSSTPLSSRSSHFASGNISLRLSVTSSAMFPICRAKSLCSLVLIEGSIHFLKPHLAQKALKRPQLVIVVLAFALYSITTPAPKSLQYLSICWQVPLLSTESLSPVTWAKLNAPNINLADASLRGFLLT